MKLSHSFAVLLLALATTGAVFAKDRELTVTSQASTGHFNAELTVHPLADGSFDDYVRFNTEDLRSVAADLSGTHGVTWGSITLTHGDHTFSDFVSGSSTEKHGTKSGGDDTGYYTLHLTGNVHVESSNPLDHNVGEYHVHVTAEHVTPVPEPETVAMMLAGLGVVGWASRRRTLRTTLVV